MGPSFFPLDEQLGLLPGRWSPRLRRLVTLLGTMAPFGQVPDLLHLINGVAISRASVRRVTEAAGAALMAQEEQTVAHIYAQHPPDPPGAARQQVSIDGVMVPIVGGEWREAKTLVIGELAPGAPGHAGHWSTVSRVLEADGFAELATAELYRRGTFAASEVVAVADGAVWCQQFYAYHLPNAIRILDFPHAAEHLSLAAQACFGPGPDAEEWSAAQRTQLLAGEAEAVCQAVTELPVTQASDPVTADQVMRQVSHYLQERLSQMAYADFAAAGYPIGSGAVESANKRVVEARLKGAGMHWTVPNANAMLALRGVLCSQRWDATWDDIAGQRRSQRPPLPPPDPTPSRSIAQPVSQPSPRRRIAKMATPSPYFTDGKPNASHPWKRSRAGISRATNRATSRPITEI